MIMRAAFRALRIHRQNGSIAPRLESVTLDDLADGEVVIRVDYSTINYKDALAATGRGRILKRFPLVGGIDLAGRVVASQSPAFEPEQPVLVTGCGLSETHDGGYAEYARVPADWVIPIPRGLDAYQCMALGTAGFTSALAVHQLEHNGCAPERGEVAVTGATGGVGSLAIQMLAGLGYRTVAITGKEDAEGYLSSMGATRVLLRRSIDLGSKPLEEAQWAAAIDSVGGELLTWLTRTTDFWGSIASIGMASSVELDSTVLPFILRGINLLGINSVYTPRVLRETVWHRLATDLKPRNLERVVTRTISLDELLPAFDAHIQGAVTGRTIVKIS
jgi:NADPH2:quinone reductase